MEELAVKVDHLSKKYRIGLKEELHDTLGAEILSWFKSPVKSYKRLRGLARIHEDEGEDIIWALRDVSFEVKKGEVFGIIGKNGAGKSTLLKILSRITMPSAGSFEINGRVASLLEVGTGFHPELTGRENVYLNGTIHGMKKKEIDEKFDEIVAFAEIPKFIDTPVKRYSSGMKVRLGFAVAAHLNPEILIIDEVLAVGDVAFQAKCIGKLDEVSGQGRTVLFVSHNMEAVSKLCTRAMLIEQGSIKKIGPTEEVVQAYLQRVERFANYYRNDTPNPEYPIIIREIELVNDEGERVNLFHFDEEIVLKITFEILESIKGLSISWALVNQLDIIVMHSAIHDADDSFIRELQPPGIYHAEVRIPKKFLHPGSYFFRFFTWNALGQARYERLDELFWFKVTEKGFYRDTSDRRALVVPPLPWKIKVAAR